MPMCKLSYGDGISSIGGRVVIKYLHSRFFSFFFFNSNDIDIQHTLLHIAHLN